MAVDFPPSSSLTVPASKAEVKASFQNCTLHSYIYTYVHTFLYISGGILSHDLLLYLAMCLNWLLCLYLWRPPLLFLQQLFMQTDMAVPYLLNCDPVDGHLRCFQIEGFVCFFALICWNEKQHFNISMPPLRC